MATGASGGTSPCTCAGAGVVSLCWAEVAEEVCGFGSAGSASGAVVGAASAFAVPLCGGCWAGALPSVVEDRTGVGATGVGLAAEAAALPFSEPDRSAGE